MRAIDLAGQRFGRLVVIKRDEKHNSKWLCRCDCGNVSAVSVGKLRSGHTRSCGCLKAEVLNNARKKHGQARTRLYRIWCAMKHRCQGDSRYVNRGITVCDEWQNDFKAFYDWAMANGYNDKLTIDRINNKGNYEPSNCRWETFVTQANNKSNNHYGEVFGEKLTLAEASKKYDINYSTLRSRVNRDGMTLEEAVLCGKATLVRNEKNGRYERMVI